MLYNNIFGVIGLAALANGHMIMNTPVPYGKSTLNSSPLAADGSDFPCKQRTGVYDAEGADNVMTLGGSYELAFTGSAVHGGGSCQVSITYDEKPTAKSTFKVIKSYIGGCPMKNIAGNNGNNAAAVDPDTYNFTIPADLPAGKGTLIGNREMYQNCAPVTLSGGSSKRDVIAERDTAFYNSLPDMFVANIGNGCGTADSLDLVFPNPGTAVDYDGGATSTATAAPTGSCQAATGGNSPATATAVPTSAAAAPVASSNAPALSGGVFVTVAPSASASAASATVAPAASVDPAASVAPTASATVAPAASVAPASSAAPVQASSVASAAAPANTGTTGSGAQLTGACTSEGEFNCIGGSSFQQCASGSWSVVQAMAAGTTCTSGQSKSLTIAKRFTSNNRHVARRALGAEMFV
ncbi:hypothetical protein CJF30_00002001 [Rutstroemia sp. NJR-2017a BBW]|nr:hypothetical protein CJF30_00002001 [Rutstroemia sp. NJR-2017a BBW]